MMTPVIRSSFTMERTDLIQYISEAKRISYLEAEDIVDGNLHHSNCIRADGASSWCDDIVDYMRKNNMPFIDINVD